MRWRAADRGTIQGLKAAIAGHPAVVHTRIDSVSFRFDFAAACPETARLAQRRNYRQHFHPHSVLLELRRPLRKDKSEPKLRRNIRNMAVAGTSVVAVMLTGPPVTKPLTRWVRRRNWGLVKWLGLPPWLEVPIKLILLDYLLYLWHAAFHKMPAPIAICDRQSTFRSSFRGHSSVGRAPALQAGSQGFESPCLQSSLAS